MTWELTSFLSHGTQYALLSEIKLLTTMQFAIDFADAVNLGLAGMAGATIVLGVDRIVGRLLGPSRKSLDAQNAPSECEYLSVADHQAVVSTLKSEIAELRSSLIALEVRMQALKQRQDHQLEAIAGGASADGHRANFTADDLLALARQGWNAKDLARVGNLSTAEADLLARLHGSAGR